LTSSNDTFITAKPQSKKLKKFISYYYFHQSDEADYQRSFIFYPHYKHALTVYKNSKTTIGKNSSVVNPSFGGKMSVLYSINKSENFKVNMNGPFQRVGIVFNPLGINHFINKPLQDIFPGFIGEFSYFGEEFNQNMKKVFLEEDFLEKIILLDEYFENKYVDFQEPVLKKAIQKLIQSNGAIKVSELSEELEIHRRTLLRLFNRHTLMSVAEYRKLVMFRQAFNYFNQNKEEINLTDVALYSMYYDQAHFIKNFKAITKETPASLLSKISHLGEEDTFWYFK